MMMYILVDVPEQHEEPGILLSVELTARKPLCTLGVFGAFMGVAGPLPQDHGNRLREVDVCGRDLASGHSGESSVGVEDDG